MSLLNEVVKTCSKCGTEKEILEFRKRSNGRGFESWCSKCKSRQDKIRYHSDSGIRSKAIDRASKRQKENPDDARQKSKRWRERHPEKKSQEAREYAAKNRDKLAAKEQRRRAKKAKAFVEDAQPLVLYDRDEGICGICVASQYKGMKSRLTTSLQLVEADCTATKILRSPIHHATQRRARSWLRR